MCVQYIGGCLVNRGGGGRGGRGCSAHRGYPEYIGGYHEYIGGYHDACGDIMIHWGMFSTLGDVQYIGGYHDACGGASW